MKTLATAAIVFLGLGVGAHAQTPEPRRQEVTQVEEAWRKARIDGDVPFLERFYAREGRIQGMTGQVQSRDADIALFAAGKIKPKFIDHGALDIAFYGETAVVTGVDHLGGTAFGHYGEMYLRFTDVLINRDGRWQLVVQQTTPTSGF